MQRTFPTRVYWAQYSKIRKKIEILKNGFLLTFKVWRNPCFRFSIWAKKIFFIEIRYENFTIWTPGFRSGQDQYIVFCTTMSLNAHNGFHRFLSTNTSRLLASCTYRERRRSQLSIECLITHHGQKLRTR